jgi:hypothetical protein
MADEKHLSNISSAQDSVNERLDASIPSPDVSGPQSLPSTGPNQNDRLFPWLEADNQQFSAKSLSRFPLMGAVGIIGSALTAVLSALTLHFFDGKPVVTGKLPKPAAWLSIILSLNSICVQLAVTHGRSGEFSMDALDEADSWTRSDLVGSSNERANYRP